MLKKSFHMLVVEKGAGTELQKRFFILLREEVMRNHSGCQE